MRRYGYIIEEIVEYSNVAESFDYVLRGSRKCSRLGRKLMNNKESVIQGLIESISNGTYSPLHYEEHVVQERGKTRIIQVIPLLDRIALNAIMRIVEKYLNRRFIADTAASIKGRGAHYLLKRMLRDMQNDPIGTMAVYKCDIEKFYHNINQDAMMFVIRRFFKDKVLINLLERCVRLLPEGLSIGLRSSQGLGNLILSYYIDHLIKDELGEKFFRRYCDDMVIQKATKRELTPIINVLRRAVEKAGLKIKCNEQVFTLEHRCIDFLGFTAFGDGRVWVRKHIKQRFARRWKKVKSKKRKQELAASFYGIAKHADAKHLFKTITGISMKEFSQFGLQYKASDGKKRFECTYYPLGDLQNKTVVIEDFERNVKTKEGERYLVKFKDEELGDGKFFTASEELKQLLDKIEELDGLPFRTTIRRQSFGQGKVKYSFT